MTESEKKTLDLVITVDMAVEGIRKAVKAKGAGYLAGPVDNASAGCQYANNAGTGPLCIVGTVLFDLGVPAKELAYMDSEHAETITGTGVVGHLEDLGVTIEPEAFVVLDIAQMHQDNGQNWGTAQALALEALDEERKRS